MLSARDIYKSFDGVEVLKGISFEVKQGEVLAVIGPSGSGKSTLLRCITQLETLDSGEIVLCGDTLVHNNEYGRAVYASKKDCVKIGPVSYTHLKEQGGVWGAEPQNLLHAKSVGNDIGRVGPDSLHTATWETERLENKKSQPLYCGWLFPPPGPAGPTCSLIRWKVSSLISCSILQASAKAVSGLTPIAIRDFDSRQCRS